MRDAVLGARLLWGGGRRQLVRLLAMAVGLAVGIAAVLLVAQMPRVLAARNQTAADRTPVPMANHTRDARFATYVAHTTWTGRPVVRVFVSGASTTDPAPPGVERLPRPGELVLSPAARRLRDSDADFAALLPGEVTGTIDEAGLVEPTELIAYIGTGRAAPDATPTVGWGVPVTGEAADADQATVVAVELGVLLLPVVLVYLLACARVAADTRRRRYAALRLLGASRRTVMRAATVEAALAVGLGSVLGAVCYQLISPRLGRAAVLGIGWTAEQASLGTSGVAGLGLTAAVAIWLCATAVARRVDGQPLASRPAPKGGEPRWWWLVPVVLGMGLLLPLLPFDGRGHTGQALQVMVLVGSVLAGLGMLPAVAVAIRLLACRVAVREGLPVAVTVGAARLLGNAAGAARLMTGVGLLVLVATVGSGILAAAEEAASSQSTPVVVHVYANEVDDDRRAELTDLGRYGDAWSTVRSSVTRRKGQPVGDTPLERRGASVLVASCPQAAELLGPLPGCAHDTLYRVLGPATPIELRPGEQVPFRTVAGAGALTAPTAAVSSTAHYAVDASLLYTGADLPGPQPRDETYYWKLGPGIESLDRVSSALSSIAPRATANSSLDIAAVQRFRVHRATIGFAVLVGLALAAAAISLGLLDRSLQQRPEVVSLTVLGARPRTIRTAQALFALAPAVLVITAASVIGFVVANAISAFDADPARWRLQSFTAMLPAVGVAVVACALSSAVAFGTNLRAEDLRRE